MTYEEAIKRLNQITEALSGEAVPLSQATALFEEGTTLVKFCYEQLKTTKGKLFEIKKELDGLKMEESDEN